MSSSLSKKRICVLISGNGSNLQAMIDAIDDNKINGEIVGVISNKADAYGLQRAQIAGIQSYVIEHRNYESRDAYDMALMNKIDELSADCIVLAGFMRILTPEFVKCYLGKLLNVHPSLLPKYKGLNTHQRAIDSKDAEHGVSVHFVTPELDGGPVIIQSKVPIFEDDTADVLAERVQVQERQIYPLVVQWFCQNRLKMHNNEAWLDDNKLGEKGYAD